MKIIVLFSLPLINKIFQSLKVDAPELKGCKTINRLEAWEALQVKKE
jgi:hypothetical protein